MLAAAGRLAGSALRRATVDGASMEPTLESGDRVLALRGLPVRAGHLVLAADPRTGRTVVKRVADVRGGLVVLRGDNPARSTDSRHFGPVPRRLVRGRVVYRYWPERRAGRPA